MVSRFVARVLQIQNVTQSGSGKFWRGTRIARLGRAAPSPSGRNAHDRALLRTLARHEKDAALTLAWRNVIGAGFALPRDAGRRPALRCRAPSRPQGYAPRREPSRRLGSAPPRPCGPLCRCEHRRSRACALPISSPAARQPIGSPFSNARSRCSCCSRRVSGPRDPVPIRRPSTSSTGANPPMVPVVNISSAV